MKFAELTNRLEKLGFEKLNNPRGKAWIFRKRRCSIYLPRYRQTQTVDQMHIDAVRMTIMVHGAATLVNTAWKLKSGKNVVSI